MIFRMRDPSNLQLGRQDISICSEFKYLGWYSPNLEPSIKQLSKIWKKAKRAMHLLYKRMNNLQIPIDLQVQLFNYTLLPILLYGCEDWGFHNSNLIENVQNQFFSKHNSCEEKHTSINDITRTGCSTC